MPEEHSPAQSGHPRNLGALDHGIDGLPSRAEEGRHFVNGQECWVETFTRAKPPVLGTHHPLPTASSGGLRPSFVPLAALRSARFTSGAPYSTGIMRASFIARPRARPTLGAAAEGISQMSQRTPANMPSPANACPPRNDQGVESLAQLVERIRLGPQEPAEQIDLGGSSSVARSVSPPGWASVGDAARRG